MNPKRWLCKQATDVVEVSNEEIHSGGDSPTSAWSQGKSGLIHQSEALCPSIVSLSTAFLALAWRLWDLARVLAMAVNISNQWWAVCPSIAPFPE
jgi:hypothetical protein